ncbi:hypothetical protein HanPI659440_Chr16g0640291 [Helianthus annuus]|nr:hypothetical protein HanPI659440_Chr16g0640291 [Helianthus annuus]
MMARVRFGQWFGSGQAGWSVSALVPVDSVKPSRLGQTQVNSGSTQSTQDPEGFSCTLASSHSWDDTTESHLASYAQEYTGCIFKTMERLE